uniref:Peptidase aspartic putative domain-containing protein n=1 Tax=Musca domestica TaxID=7370 RepID=A0A1I8NKF0_MUSDO
MDLITINYSAENKQISVKPMSYSRVSNRHSALIHYSPARSSRRSNDRDSQQRDRSSSPELYERRSRDRNLTGVSKKQMRRWPCMICKKDHRLATCDKYRELSTHERLEFVRKLQYCVNCLAVSHTIALCNSVKTCIKCHKRHHSSLHHMGEIKTPLEKPIEKPKATPLTPATANIFRRQVIIPTVRLALIYNGIRRIVRALINPSQPYTTISETIVKQCKLATTKVDDEKSMCAIQLGTVQNVNWILDVQALMTDVLPLRPYPRDLKISSPFDGLVLADPDFYVSDEVHIVMAADVFPKIITDGFLHDDNGDIVAQGSVFGWTLTGSVSV